MNRCALFILGSVTVQLAGLLGCAHSSRQLKVFSPETVSISIGYPQGPGAYNGSTYLGDSTAAPCAAFDGDTIDWVRTRVKADRHNHFSLRVPSRYSPRKMPELSGEDYDRGEALVASWEYLLSGSPLSRQPSPFVAVWSNHDLGFPTMARSGTTSHQEATEECRLPGYAGQLISFAVVDSARATTYYVAAYWKISPGLWLKALGFGPDSLLTPELRRVFTSFESSH